VIALAIETEIAKDIAELAFSFIAEWGHPSNFGEYPCRRCENQCDVRHFNFGSICADDLGAACLGSLVGELLSLSKQREVKVPAGQYLFGNDLVFRPIYVSCVLPRQDRTVTVEGGAPAGSALGGRAADGDPDVEGR